MKEYSYEIAWDGDLSVLNAALSAGLSKASEGKYTHGRVLKAKLLPSINGLYHVSVTVRAES